MKLLQELRYDFAGITEGSVIAVTSLGETEKIIVHRSKTDGIMVGLQIDDKVPPISEFFTSCRIFDSYFTYKGQKERYLFLSCNALDFKHEFASLCCEFLEPGPNDQYREELLNNPRNWWRKWIKLLGNSITERNVYCVIAEMTVLDYLFQQDNTVSWLAAKRGVRDIESDTETFEVKSTIRRTGYEITISSSFQLDNIKPFWIFFCRMEECKNEGFSIKDMYQQLISHGYDDQKLLNELTVQGLDLNNHLCNEKYKIIERTKYLVDENFPKITDSSFVGGHRPKGVDKITYTVDLNAIEGRTW